MTRWAAIALICRRRRLHSFLFALIGPLSFNFFDSPTATVLGRCARAGLPKGLTHGT